MLQNELANEVSSSGYLTHGSCHEEIKDVFNLFNMLFIVFLVLHELVDKRIYTWKVKLWLSSQDLSDRELIIGSCYLFFLTWLFVIHLLEVILGFLSLFHGRFFHAVCIEPELLIKNSISVVRSLHVLISKGDWDNEINVIVVDNIDNQANGYYEASIFEVCELNIQGTELNSPSNLWLLRRWRFESQRIPVCRLKVFKVTNKVSIIDLFF